ncbi:MAG: hypothetical protein II151_00130, partial [Bacteroidales bacterium]|nr:hypothetical protein [Bacteroidales bacterium]
TVEVASNTTIAHNLYFIFCRFTVRTLITYNHESIQINRGSGSFLYCSCAYVRPGLPEKLG